MNILIIGKNSFLGTALLNSPYNFGWTFKTYLDVIRNPSLLLEFDIILNFAFDPNAYTNKLDAEKSLDTLIANIIVKRSHIHYIMISSRQVYGQNAYLTEGLEPAPVSIYGINKLNVENRVLEVLGASRVTILRCSNIFGFELKRRTFFGRMLTSLYKHNLINFDVSLSTKKDIIPVMNFCSFLSKIFVLQPTGIYNLGSGISLRCGTISEDLISGFGQGKLQCFSPLIKDQFFMDIEKITSVIGKPRVTTEAIREEVKILGKKLRCIEKGSQGDFITT